MDKNEGQIVDTRTNELMGVHDEETIRTVYDIIGVTLAISPLLRVTPGMKAGQTELHLATEDGKRDVVKVAALLDARSPERLVLAVVRHAVDRGFISEEQIRENWSALGWKLQLANDPEDKRTIRYHWGVSQKTNPKAKSKKETLLRFVAGRIDYIGKTTGVKIRHKSEVDDKAKQDSVRITFGEKFESQARAMLEQCNAEQLTFLANTIVGMVGAANEAQAIVNEDAEVTA